MKKLYDLCKKNGILFISEEVQQGFYRTGKFFGIEHYDIIPDGIIMGKSIGAGFPLGGLHTCSHWAAMRLPVQPA